MGVSLKRAGYPFTVFEKSDGVGGTWRDNTFPGAACDVPSHLYSYSFEPNPWWSRTYATQPEILAYLERCCERYGVGPHVRTGTAIRRARLGRRHQDLGADGRVGRDLHGRRGGERARDVERPVRPRHPRRRALRGPGLPLGPLGPLQVRGRRAGGLDRHRGQCHPVRAGDRPRGRAPERVPALAGVGVPPDRPGLQRRRTAPVRPGPPGRPTAPPGDLDDLPAGPFHRGRRPDHDDDRVRPVLPRPQG